jgi:hypothetical protein
LHGARRVTFTARCKRAMLAVTCSHVGRYVPAPRNQPEPMRTGVASYANPKPLRSRLRVTVRHYSERGPCRLLSGITSGLRACDVLAYPVCARFSIALAYTYPELTLPISGSTIRVISPAPYSSGRHDVVKHGNTVKLGCQGSDCLRWTFPIGVTRHLDTYSLTHLRIAVNSRQCRSLSSSHRRTIV